MENKVKDYHDFCTIETSRADREKWYIGDIYINAATCLDCNEYIRSRNKHDYVSCTCGKTSVDGGSWYARRSGTNYINDIVLFKDIETDEEREQKHKLFMQSIYDRLEDDE